MKPLAPAALVFCSSTSSAYAYITPHSRSSKIKTPSRASSRINANDVIFRSSSYCAHSYETERFLQSYFLPKCSSPLSLTATTSSETTSLSDVSIRERSEREELTAIRTEGGRLAFQTKYGALNPYGIFYGLTSIFLGLSWFLEVSLCRFMYFVSRSKFDAKRRLPMFFSQLWGETLMFLTRNNPEREGNEILKEFFKTGKSAMFVSNHNSWMDIPYLGCAIGWRNYKFVAKKELLKVPILSAAMRAGGHVLIDRGNRRSQLMTLKQGIQWLKDGVHLCTFPEGTRSRTGRLMEFKNGAFLMAHKAGSPVIPVSIVAAGKVHPSNFMFPCRGSSGVAKVVVHPPVYPEGKSEKEMAAEVRAKIISGLPEEQRPEEE